MCVKIKKRIPISRSLTNLKMHNIFNSMAEKERWGITDIVVRIFGFHAARVEFKKEGSTYRC